ncbi:hypothetical protein [Photobacterium galatheae]|uniref:Uncharacterized protein n=1 Tax=Photobacterium galatheae TaxID=1654360 RepID=A0A066RKV6_9GAMM|nr:hypothetical protein [Photobacterium galatheae]KDM89716.1 hypothetical protein EA58_21150 [Photobacterium galatheae]MCM0151532.1 hypothetical protein [Photobacterium galatheae]
MNKGHMMVAADELKEAFVDVGFPGSAVDAFVTIFEYVEDATGEWFALDAVKAQSFHLAHDMALLTLDDVFTGWFAFWMCVFNSAEHGSMEEFQAMGAIRGLFFMAGQYRQVTLPAAIQTWWEQTADIHHNPSLNEV